MTITDIRHWQAEYRAAPCVYAVLEEGELADLYETREGAELHVAFIKRNRGRARVVKLNIHSDKLARQRWT